MRSIRWRQTGVFALALALLIAASPDAAPAQEAQAAEVEPVALMVRLNGDVSVQRAEGEPMAGEVGLALVPGDEVRVGEASEAVVLYRTGRLLRAEADVTIEEVEGSEPSSLFTNTLRTLGQVATTDARTQPNRQGMIRPVAGTPVPIAPRNGITVLDVRPTFTWFRVPAADRYTIQIQREGPDAPPPVRYDAGSDTTWSYPRSEPPLVPGATYVWTVGGQGAGRVAAPKRFTVASAEDVAAVQDVMDGLIEAGLDPAGDGLFLTALAYRDAGLHYEALRAIRRIEEAGSAAGRSFYMLKGEVLNALGMIDDAQRAFRMAEDAED